MYRLDRSEEDWSLLADRSRHIDPWDSVKYVPFAKDGWYASFGGEVRLFYENYRNYIWGVGSQDANGFLLTRLLGHGDVHLGRRARVFVELKSGLLAGRNGGPRPPDEDRLDIGQAFVELAAENGRAKFDLRLGRQELAYGEGAVVWIRELNVRREFDGVRGRLRVGRWRTDGFWVRPATTRTGMFDDASDSTQKFWGVYATQERRAGSISEVGAYYLGLTRDSARFDQGSAPDQRHTVGGTVHAKTGPISHAGEGTIQFGSFGDGQLRAWKYAHRLSHTWPETKLSPVVSLLGAISSGDKDPTDRNLQTFYPLFPKGLYYGHIDDSGSLNAIVVHPQLVLQVSPSVTVQSDTFVFWRQRTTDGLYSQPGTLLRPSAGSRGRYVGALQDIEILWRADLHTTVQLLATYYWAGQFLRSSRLPGENTVYVGAKVSYRF